jgi:hypothetical protein
VIAYTPGVVVVATATVMLDAVPVTLVGVNANVIPAGPPPALNVTAPAKLVRVIVTSVLPVRP